MIESRAAGEGATMSLTTTASSEADLATLRDSVRLFLEAKSPIAAVRELMATDEGFDRDVWHQMAAQLGLQGISLPEEFGGSGFGLIEQLVVFEELGRALYCGPYFATVALAAGLLVQCDDADAKREYLTGISSGELIATVALVESDQSWSYGDVNTRAQRDGDQWHVSGIKPFVIDGMVADLVLVPAMTDDGLSLFAVEGSAEGLTKKPLDVMDATRKQAQLTFDAAPGRLIGTAGRAGEWLDALLITATISLTGEQVGGAKRLLEVTVDYAKTREQFGRFIGSFQAIKHKCATLYLETESAGAVARYAAWTVDEGMDDARTAASMAKSYCSDVFTHAAAENIQIHGGVGFTWDNDAHLFLRRAKTSEVLLGDAVFHRGLLAEHLGI
jgi:alkylation response protein AidB-like acyl-CoA dehydrogenase